MPFLTAGVRVSEFDRFPAGEAVNLVQARHVEAGHRMRADDIRDQGVNEPQAQGTKRKRDSPENPTSHPLTTLYSTTKAVGWRKAFERIAI